MVSSHLSLKYLIDGHSNNIFNLMKRYSFQWHITNKLEEKGMVYGNLFLPALCLPGSGQPFLTLPQFLRSKLCCGFHTVAQHKSESIFSSYLWHTAFGLLIKALDLYVVLSMSLEQPSVRFCVIVNGN